jgi:hypothetical protein
MALLSTENAITEWGLVEIKEYTYDDSTWDKILYPEGVLEKNNFFSTNLEGEILTTNIDGKETLEGIKIKTGITSKLILTDKEKTANSDLTDLLNKWASDEELKIYSDEFNEIINKSEFTIGKNEYTTVFTEFKADEIKFITSTRIMPHKPVSVPEIQSIDNNEPTPTLSGGFNTTANF